jgi:uncharacterized metal-binding protein YceD (DUF177 family)
MSEYKVKLTNLNKNSNEHLFIIKETFFKNFSFSDITNSEIIVTCIASKKGEKISLSININGVIKNLLCDNCAENIHVPINSDSTFVIKQSDENNLNYDDILYVGYNDNFIEIKHLIYELITLAVPSKRSHKSISSETECNKDMKKLIDKYSFREDEKDVDPRWAALKNLNLNK